MGARGWGAALVVALAGCSSEDPCRDCAAPPPPPHVDVTDGWDDAPGNGRVHALWISVPPAEVGLDLDGRCEPSGRCVDHDLATLGSANFDLHRARSEHDLVYLLEIAGIDEPFFGDDARVTVKIYRGLDRDGLDHPDQAGEAFFIDRQSLEEIGGQPRIRLRGSIAAGRLTASPAALASLHLRDGVLALREVHLEATVDPPRIRDGLFGAAIPLASSAQLSAAELPDSQAASYSGRSLAERLLAEGTPRVDLDGDGLEQVVLQPDGAVGLCFDGCSGCARGAPVAPLEAAHRASCLLAPQLADGHGISLWFEGILARIEGVE